MSKSNWEKFENLGEILMILLEHGMRTTEGSKNMSSVTQQSDKSFLMASITPKLPENKVNTTHEDRITYSSHKSFESELMQHLWQAGGSLYKQIGCSSCVGI